MANKDYQRKQYLKEFYRRSNELLNEEDKNYLYNVLKEYQSYKEIDKLVQCLNSALDTPEKKDLLKEIRNLIPLSHLKQFDMVAPYHRMRHPILVGRNHTMPRKMHKTVAGDGRLTVDGRVTVDGRGQRHTRASAKKKMNLSASLPRNPQLMREDPGIFKVVTINKAVNEEMGLSIRGGKEHGLGVYVSDVEEGSIADLAGLEPGDHIIEVNNVSFDSIASSSAVKVFAGSCRLRMVIKRTGKVPGAKYSKEKVSWYDTSLDSIIEGEFDDTFATGYTSGMPMLNGLTERRVNLTITSREQFLGLNIRGGSEYGLGIYVSKVDEGGLAQLNGIRVGDQIVDVNGTSFEDVSHAEAVGFFQKQKRLMLTVREVGRFPLYKLMYAKYNWVEGDTLKRQRRRRRRYRKNPQSFSKTGNAVKNRYQRKVKKGPSTSQSNYFMRNRFLDDDHYSSQESVTQIPRDLRVESFTQTSLDREPTDIAIQTEIDYQDKAILALPTEVSNESIQNVTLSATELEITPVEAPIEEIVPVRADFASAAVTPSVNLKKHRSNSIDITASGPPSVFPSMNVRRRSSVDVGATMRLTAEVSPMARILPHSSIDDAVVDPVEASSIRSGGQVSESSIDAELSSILTSSMPSRREDSKMSLGGMSTGSFLQVPGAVVEEPDKDGQKGDKKVKRSRTFKEMLFRKRSFSRKDKDKSSGESKESKSKSKSKLGKKKTKDEDSKSRKSSSSESSGKKGDDDSSDTLSNGKNLFMHQKGHFEYGAGTQMMLGDMNQSPSMSIVLELAKKLLNEDETTAIMRHIKQYHGNGDVEALVLPLMAILDKPEKMLLIREIRDVINPTDLGRFDSMVSYQEMRAYEELATRMSELSAVIMNRGKPEHNRRRRKTLMASIPDHRGNFHLKTQEEYERDRERRHEMEKKQKELTQKLRKDRSSDGSIEQIPFPNLYAKDQAITIPIGRLKIDDQSENDSPNRSDDTSENEPIRNEERGDFLDDEPMYAAVEKVKKQRRFSLPTGEALLSRLSPEKPEEGTDGFEYRPLGGLLTSTPGPASPPKGILKNDRSNSKKSLNWDSGMTLQQRTGGENSKLEKLETVQESFEEDLSQRSGMAPIRSKESTNTSFELKNKPTSFLFNSRKSNKTEKSEKKEDSKRRGSYTFNNLPDPQSARKPHSSHASFSYDLPTRTLHSSEERSNDDDEFDDEVMLISVRRDSERSGDSETEYEFLPGKPTSERPLTPYFHAPPPPSTPPPPEQPVLTPPLPEQSVPVPPPPPALPPYSMTSSRVPLVPSITITSDEDDSELEADLITVRLPKKRQSLGISVSGGSNSDKQPQVKIEKVFPHGAANEDKRVQAGMEIYSVDGALLVNATHHEAVELIRRAYNDKSTSDMTLVLKQ